VQFALRWKFTLLSSTIGPAQYHVPAGTTTRPPPAALQAWIAARNAGRESNELAALVCCEPGLVSDAEPVYGLLAAITEQGCAPYWVTR
jgi:hypothetical protein